MVRLNRRQVLGSSGALLAGGLAGCAEQLTPPSQRPTGGSDGTAPDDGFQWPGAGVRSFGTITIGDRSGVSDPEDNRPHSLVLWNDLEAERSVRIRITEGGNVRYDETPAFPRNEALEIELLEPGVYHVRIDFADRVGGRFSVPRSQFDCNESVTEIRLPPEGTVQRRTVSTEIGCRPRISQTRFFVDSRECGNGDSAGISFDGEETAVSGRIEVPTPCNGAALADAEVITEEETLRIDVGITPPLPNETCLSCIGVIEYRASVFVDRGSVSNAVVYHDGTEITRVTR